MEQWEYEIKSKANNKSEIEIMRNNIHNTDLNDKQQRDAFYYDITQYIKKREQGGFPLEYMLHIHNAQDGKITVGYGFNMTDHSEERWNKFFQDFIGEVPDYNLIKTGKQDLTPQQAEYLLKSTLTMETIPHIKQKINNDYNEGKIQEEINYFAILKPNEKFAVIDIYYNSGGTMFGRNGFEKYDIRKELQLYIQKQDPQYLANAYNKVKAYGISAASKYGQGLVSRYRDNAIMLESYNCPIYSKPNESNLPKQDLYFTWHHNSTSKDSRKHHIKWDGQTFKVGDSEWQEMGQYNCRCSYTIINK
jgi:hypothetical protein